MNKSNLIILFSLFLLSGCFPDCTYEESFNFKGDVPNINLAVSDSVVIDMSKYWEAEASCETYTPIIKQAKENKNLTEIRSVDEFLIITGIQEGSSKISVKAEKRNTTYDTADCSIFNASTNPISFSISVGKSTDYKSDKITPNIQSRISSLDITPESFVKGDTVQIEFKTNQASVSYSTWFIDSGTIISEKSPVFSNCTDGYVISQSNKILMVVESENQIIEGYVHLDNPEGDAKKTGMYFNFQSQNKPTNKAH